MASHHLLIQSSKALTTMSLASVVLFASSTARAAGGGCQKDSDCKGDRICENGRCVAPTQTRLPTTAVEPATRGGEAGRDNQVRPQPAATEAPPGTLSPSTVGVLVVAPQPPPDSASLASFLTDAQLAELRSAGIGLDARDVEIATRLRQRGFSGDDFVAAHREQTALRLRYPELAAFGRDMVETVAVAQQLGLSENNRYWFVWDRHDRQRSLTDAYNDRVLARRGLKTAGWIFSGIGAGLALGGGILMDEIGIDYGWGKTGAGMLAVGGAAVVTGIVCLLIGYQSSGNLPPNTIDTATADRLRSLRASQR